MNLRDHGRPAARGGCKRSAPVLQGARRFVCKKTPESPDVGGVRNGVSAQIRVFIPTVRTDRVSQPHRALSGRFAGWPVLQDCKTLRTPRLQDEIGAVLAGGSV